MYVLVSLSSWDRYQKKGKLKVLKIGYLNEFYVSGYFVVVCVDVPLYV